MNRICVVIPAYQPSLKLITLVNNLIKKNIQKIIIIDDGSSPKYKKIFSDLENIRHVTLIKHNKNLGKGAALKSAFKNLLFTNSDEVIVTADADGQHLVEDIVSVASAVTLSKMLVIGYRNFDGKIPLRSLVGNYITKKVFNIIHNSNLLDTQTGLRGFSKDLIPWLLEIPGNGYEYETNILSKIIKKNIKINQVPISTIYIDNNSSSHFNPLLDSVKIYLTFLRYFMVSFLSFIIDILIFYILIYIGYGVFFGTYFSRIISGFLNFTFNKKFAFNSCSPNFNKELFLYIVLCIVISSLSASLVDNFSKENLLEITKIKILVDIFLFFFSFLIQRFIVFR